jgi:hypothetical protein
MAEASPVNLVTLEGYVKDAQGQAAPGISVYIRVKPSLVPQGNTTFSTRKITLLTDDDGYFSIQLLAAHWVTVSIPYCLFQKTGLLPFTGTINMYQLGG